MDIKHQTVPSENPNGFCRLCFSNRNLVALFPCDDQPQQLLLDQISQCTGIRIENAENYPRSICWRCAVALEDFQLFRQRSLENDAIIKKEYPFSTTSISDTSTKWLVSIPAQQITMNNCEGTDNEKVDESLIKPLTETFDSDPIYAGFSSTKMDELNMGDSDSSKHTTCYLCNHEFGSRQSLYAHFKEQHSDRGRPHKCGLCSATFKRRSHLEDHVSSHTGAVRYHCKECGAKYAKSKSLIRHRKLAHAILPLAIRTVNKPGVTGGEFKCKYCPKSFKHRPSLNFHIKSHYDMLPNVCDVCGAKFVNEKGLRVHKGKYHPTDVFKTVPSTAKEPRKLVQCSLCPRYFEQRRYLTQHMKFIHPRCNEIKELTEASYITEQQSSNHELGDKLNGEIEPVTIKFEVEDNNSINGGDTDI